MSGTTSVNDLPIFNSSNSNIQLVQSENINISNPLQQQIPSRELDINTSNNDLTNIESYNELISGLQNASKNGQTTLPDRNIPQNTTSHTIDEIIQPNYIPENKEYKYVENEITNNDIISYNKKMKDEINSIDNYYQEFQQPILIAILYFLFQLPIIHKYLYKIIPSLFKADGNPSFIGYLLNSIIFSIIFYLLTKIINYFSSI